VSQLIISNGIDKPAFSRVNSNQPFVFKRSGKMSHSVVVFSGEPKFIGGGTMNTNHFIPGTDIPHAQSFFWDVVAKQEEEDDGAIVVHLRPGCCVQKTDQGYAIYVCSGGIHGKPIMVLSPETVLRLEGNHEVEFPECYENLPVM
jgi:hypothetical protein